jgi:hypothetical protein
MMPFFLLLLAVADGASCGFGALAACPIGPQSCGLWVFGCENHAKIRANFTVIGGAVRAYVLPGDSDTCNGAREFGLCGYPGDVTWCLETRMIATEGRCTLVLWNTNTLVEATVDGAFSIVPPDASGIPAFTSLGGSVGALFILFALGLCIGCAAFAVLCSRRCGGMGSPPVIHYVHQADDPSAVEMS